MFSLQKGVGQSRRPCHCVLTQGRLVLGDFLFTDIRVDPIHDQIRNLIAVLVIHNHMTVAVDTEVRGPQQLSIAAGSFDASDEQLRNEGVSRWSPNMTRIGTVANVAIC